MTASDPTVLSEPRHRLPTLTAREMEVLRLVAAGHRSRDVADILCLSKSTVDSHLAKMFGKLGVHNRILAVRAALRLSRKE